MMLYLYRVSVKFYPVKFEVNKVVLLNIVNLVAIAFFYLIFYNILPSNLLIKFVLMALLAGLVVYISGLTKAKVLLKRSVPVTGESKRADVKDEYIP